MDTGDRVLCHACGRVWPRNSHETIECPYCSSDFTEIIEIPPDPEDDDSEPEASSSHPDPPESFPGHHRSPSPPRPPRLPLFNPWADHDPWAHDDDVETHGWSGPGYQYTQRTFRSPGGNLRFSFQAQRMQPRGPAATQREMNPDPVQGINSFFQTISEANRERAGRAGGRSPTDRYQPGHRFDDMHGAGNTWGAWRQPSGGLSPRDADGPQPMGTPLRTLGDILEILHHDLGTVQAGGADRNGGPNVRVMNGGTPLGALLSAMFNIERNGDAVYSQEELDRVITQLFGQNGGRNAAPPASQDAIHALPKKPATVEMLGPEGSSECSICMDVVKLGDEVSLLPCTHWFHPQCIEAWLNQHNTCPHCRRGIDPTSADASSSANANPTSTAPSEGMSGTSDRTRRSGSLSSARPPDISNREPGSSSQAGEGSSGGGGGWANWVRSRLGGGS
ncbi:putative RING finger domain protein [Aspergillus undulatus]|uniref:putative RING finger domain protein n=1 Tax=Aspergillus undulatus TaxID=1810928 RepID=UPI003CCD5CB8